MQLAIGEFITDSSQGLRPHQGCEDEKAPSPSSLGYLLGTIISWRKWIGYAVARQFLLAQPFVGFQLSPDRFPLSC